MDIYLKKLANKQSIEERELARSPHYHIVRPINYFHILQRNLFR